MHSLLLYLKVAVLKPEPWEECALRTTLVFKKVTICHPELRECSSRAACVLETCGFSRSCGNAFRVLLLYSKLAILTLLFAWWLRTWNLSFQPELQRTTFVRTNCDFAVGVLGVLFAYYFCTLNLQAFSRSCGNALRVLVLYLEVAIFEPELQERALRTTFVRTNCEFPAGFAGVRFVYYF